MSVQTQDQVLDYISARTQKTVESALEKMTGGFCIKSQLTAAEIGFIFESYEQASTIKITSAGVRGQRLFSIYDLLGHSVSGMNYIVTDHASFNRYVSMTLENDFMKKNPEAHSRIRASFTSFIHENKLHWSRCCGNHSAAQNRAIREKLRTLSNKTGKSHAEILSQLLDFALQNTSVT